MMITYFYLIFILYLMSRYIVRSKYVEHEPSETYYNAIGKHFTTFIYPKLIDILYDYKDEIDYNSALCIVKRKFRNTPVIVNDSIYERGNILYKINYKKEIDYITEHKKHLSETSYLCSYEFSTYPVAVLLFNKFNECKEINIKYEDLKDLFFASNTINGNTHGNLINIGKYIFYMDALFNSETNKFDMYIDKQRKQLYSEIEIDKNKIDFISKDRPSIINLHNEVSGYIKNYIKNNIESIKMCLGIEPDDDNINDVIKFIPKCDKLGG